MNSNLGTCPWELFEVWCCDWGQLGGHWWTFLSIHKNIPSDLLDEFRVKKSDSLRSLVGQLLDDDFFITVTSLIWFNLCCLLIFCAWWWNCSILLYPKCQIIILVQTRNQCPKNGNLKLKFYWHVNKEKGKQRTSRFAVPVKNTTVLKSLSPIGQHTEPPKPRKGWDDDCLA